MNDLEKAKKVLENPHFKVRAFAKENNINNSTLYKYMADPQKMSSGVWDTIHKLAKYYDNLYYKKMLTEIDPRKIHNFEKWIENSLPQDPYGDKIREIILDNKRLYFEIANSK